MEWILLRKIKRLVRRRDVSKETLYNVEEGHEGE